MPLAYDDDIREDLRMAKRESAHPGVSPRLAAKADARRPGFGRGGFFVSFFLL